MPLDALEYVVRPYTAPDAHGRIIIPSTPSFTRERATLTWGASSDALPAAGGINFQVNCCSDALDEISRESDDVDIPIQDAGTGPGHVTVSRPNSMKLSKKSDDTCGGPSWDQISSTAQMIDSDLAGLQSLMDQTFGASSKNCGQSWKFKNQDPNA
jgi:hypothetical protein